MGFFETLMNLDVELSCLATKAFVAKEEFVDKVCYPIPNKKKDKKQAEKAAEEAKVQNEVNVNDSYNELKQLMDEAMELGGDTQIIQQLDAGIKQSIGDLRTYIERTKQEKEKQKILQENPDAINPLLAHMKTNPDGTVGMDFSNLQNGVQYDEANRHTLNIQAAPAGTTGKPVTQADLDVAFANANAQATEKSSKKK